MVKAGCLGALRKDRLWQGLSSQARSQDPRWEAALLEFSAKTFRRRMLELHKAAKADLDPCSKGILLFYAAECGLKAAYMKRNNLKNSSETNGTASRSASDFKHRLDQIVRELKVPLAKLAKNPGQVTLDSGGNLEVAQIHEAWRYGGRVKEHVAVEAWLQGVVNYAVDELR